MTLVIAMAFTSCNKSELEPMQNSACTIKASIDNFGTKTTMEGNDVYWAEGDEIALFAEGEEDPILFTLSGGAGTTDGTFTTTVNIDGKSFVAALYPYYSGARFEDGKKITTNMPSEYEWAEGANNKAPMATLISGNQEDISFKNAGALIALTVNNIPEGYNCVRVRTENTRINGNCDIEFDDNSYPILSISSTPFDEENTKITTINFTSSSNDKIFYFPFSVWQNQKKIKITIEDNLGHDKILYNSDFKPTSNKRYYKTINFDANGNKPVSVTSENVDATITEGYTSLIVTEDIIAISGETNSDLQISVQNTNESFTIEGNGPNGNIDLHTPSTLKKLTVNTPNATVEIHPHEGFATFETITATTAENTLIIPANVTVNNLVINGGNVKVYGNVNNITNETAGKIKIYKEQGAVIPENIDTDKFDIIDNTNNCIAVKHDGNLNYYPTFDAALDAHQNGETIILTGNYELPTSITIPADKQVILDLNGYTLSHENECTAHYEMIKNNGKLTIKGKGTISFKNLGDGSYTHSSWGTYTIRNNGELIISLDNTHGKIEHLGPKEILNSGDPICYVIDNHTAGKVIINSGIISSPASRTIRNFYTDAIIEINGGTFIGQIWMQQGGAVGTGDYTTKIGSLTINGGNFSPAGADGSSVFITNHGADNVKLTVTGGTFNTKIGCNDATRDGVKGKITGGKFTESAKTYTNPDLFATGSWSDLVDGFYTFTATSN